MGVGGGGVLFFDRGDFLARLFQLLAQGLLVGEEGGELRVLLGQLRGQFLQLVGRLRRHRRSGGRGR